MTRMLNPFLGDLVDRVARDPMRKLGWDDRLVGTMRLALSQGILPRRFALGAAAALIHWKPELRRQGAPDAALREAWSPDASSVDSVEPGAAAKVLELVREALPHLRAWLAGGPSPFGNSSTKA
jgi:mannitol-1-phosphate 5-dehydrogenase